MCLDALWSFFGGCSWRYFTDLHWNRICTRCGKMQHYEDIPLFETSGYITYDDFQEFQLEVEKEKEAFGKYLQERIAKNKLMEREA